MDKRDEQYQNEEEVRGRCREANAEIGEAGVVDELDHRARREGWSAAGEQVGLAEELQRRDDLQDQDERRRPVQQPKGDMADLGPPAPTVERRASIHILR